MKDCTVGYLGAQMRRDSVVTTGRHWVWAACIVALALGCGCTARAEPPADTFFRQAVANASRVEITFPHMALSFSPTVLMPPITVSDRALLSALAARLRFEGKWASLSRGMSSPPGAQLEVIGDSEPPLTFFVRQDGAYLKYGPIDDAWTVPLAPGFIEYVWESERAAREGGGGPRDGEADPDAGRA